MHPTQLQAPRCGSLRTWLIGAIATTAAASSAWADEPSPYYIGASTSFTHDSNVYRVADGPGDNYWSVGLLGGIDQTISRQRVYANANVQYHKYSDQTNLDNTSYGVSAGWDWATIEKLSGRFYGSASQGLAGNNNNNPVLLPNGNVAQPDRNILKTQQVGTTVRWGGQGLLSLEGSYAYSRVRYSSAQYIFGDSTGQTAGVAVYYQVGADTKVGTGLRFTHTYSPYAIALTPTPTGPDDYTSSTSNGRNIDLSVDWRPTAKSGLNARISYTTQTNPGGSGEDFSGLTGAITASYAATGKTTLTASASRDAGANSQFFNGIDVNTGTPISGLIENTRVTNSFSLGAAYAATAKIQVNAGWQYIYAKLVNTSTVGGGSFSGERNDISRIASLSANYAVARNVQLGCSVSRLSRGISGGGGGYDANTIGCSAQATLR